MKIDYEKLKNTAGIDIKGNYKEQDLLFYIKSILYNLRTHNKNYTKEQYDRITLLDDIFNCID